MRVESNKPQSFFRYEIVFMFTLDSSKILGLYW